MVVHNTQYANSKTVADYYAAARGLDTAHVQGYDFGTADTITSPVNRDAFRNGVLTTIRDYMETNAIEGVAVSINCPLLYQHDETQPVPEDQHSSLCLTIGGADRVVTVGGSTRPFNPMYVTVENAYWPNGNTSSEAWSRNRLREYPIVIANTYCNDYRSGKIPVNDGAGPVYYHYVPCGRLGRHIGMGQDDAALAMRCIDDAVWFEENGEPLNETMLFGFSDRTGGMEQGNVWDAYRLVSDRIRCETYDGNRTDLISSKYSVKSWGWDQPAITIPDQATWLTGGGPVKTLWGWLGLGFENDADSYLPSVIFRRGAWMFESTSTPVSQYSLSAGACAAIIPTQEPYALGLPEIGSLMWNLLHGYSLAEASICAQASNFGYSVEVWGDPFYTPFVRLRLKRGNGISIET